MFNILIVSEQYYGKSLIACSYLKDLGGKFFSVECAGFEPGFLNPLVNVIMKLDGFELSTCNCPHTVFDLFEMGRRFDIVITVCSKRLADKCPDFPGQLLRLNWRHSDPDKIVESRIDRIQQMRITRDNIKADVINFIQQYEQGKWNVLK